MKTKEDVRKMRETIQQELSSLPEYNSFGESNAAEKEDLKKYVIDLVRLENGADWNLLTSVDVTNWFTETNWSPLNDYE